MTEEVCFSSAMKILPIAAKGNLLMNIYSNPSSAQTQAHDPSKNKISFPPVLQAATAYAKMGFRLLPIPYKTKSPRMKGWVDKATHSRRTLHLWFQEKGPQNLGVATGKRSGMVVLDVDIKNDSQGEHSLNALVEQYGPLPDTPRVRTGSGGLHYFFAYPAEGNVPTVHATSRGQHPLGAGLDLQSDGAQVVLPPSIHPNGNAYKWEVSPQQTPFAPLPDWLYKLVTAPPSPFADLEASPVSGTNVVSLYREQHYAQTALERETEAVVQAPKGTRNNTLNTACVCLGGFVPTGLLTEQDIVQAMLQACQHNGHLKEKGRRATLATIQSGLKKGKTSPRHVPDRSLPSSSQTRKVNPSSSKGSKSSNPTNPQDWMSLLSFTQKGLPCASLANVESTGVEHPNFFHYDARRGWSLRPGAKGWHTWEGRAYIEINRDGLRDREHTFEKPEDVYRIAVLGDSFAEALQVDRTQTFWAYLERELPKCEAYQGKKVEVINFGVSGYGTGQELLTLQEHVWKYHPDFVLLAFYNGNDLQDNVHALSHVLAEHRPYFRISDGRLVLDLSFVEAVPWRKRVGYRGWTSLRIVQWVKHKIHYPLAFWWDCSKGEGERAPREQAFLHLVEPKTSEWSEAWTVTEAILKEMHAEVQRHGADWVVVQIGAPLQVNPDASKREEVMRALGVEDLFYPERRLERIGREIGFRVIVLAPAMLKESEARQECFYGRPKGDPCNGHFNQEGHRLAGELITQALCTKDSTS